METVKLEISVEKLEQLLKTKIGKTFRVEHNDDTGSLEGNCSLLENGEVVVFWDCGTALKLSPFEIGCLLDDNKNLSHRITRL